jgi:hypothetical protein
VDTVSHSKYWSSTAIFVVEDDAQAGPDHVDAHRTTAEVISPYTQTGQVDSTFYSTASMLRTIELFAGIGPMTQFDAAANPMFNSFTSRPDLAPYNVIKPPQHPDPGQLRERAAGRRDSEAELQPGRPGQHATARRGGLAERQGCRKHDAASAAQRHRPRRLHR